MKNFSIEKSTETIKLYMYKYLWKDKDNNIGVKFICGTQEEHAKFQSLIRDDNNIVSCMREYINEINTAYINFTEPVKNEEKGVEENETV